MTSTPEDPSGIEREIGQTQAHLASTVDELAARVAPKAVAQRGVASAQAKARSLVLDSDGALRTDRVAAAGGSVVALLTTLVALAVRRRRRRRSTARRSTTQGSTTQRSTAQRSSTQGSAARRS